MTTLMTQPETLGPVEPALPKWPQKPSRFGELLTPIEAAQYLRLDETGRHTPKDEDAGSIDTAAPSSHSKDRRSIRSWQGPARWRGKAWIISMTLCQSP
jgi:hypothetical protein